MTEVVTRYCKACDTTKPADAFYKGVESRCKECHKAAVKKNYEAANGRAEYERERTQRPDRKAKSAVYVAAARERSPEKYKARTAVGNAVRDGRILKLPCEVCGDPKSQAHHHDYSRASRREMAVSQTPPRR